MRKIIILIVALAMLSSCHLFEERRLSGSVVEYNGKTITVGELQSITSGLTAEDSARVAEQYIRQWAINLIEYEIAKDQNNKTIEKLVEDYRRSLYLHEYEKNLIARRMPRAVEDTLVQAFYEQHQEQLILSETIIQGLLLVVPIGAPNMKDLHKNIQQPDSEENIEWIEKFAYQYAVGYELFLEEWKSANELFLHMPFERDYLNKQLKGKSQIELQDSTNVYLLQITDFYRQGARMPLSYARKEIENIILRQRQVEFVQRERELLYEEAIKQGKIKLYEK